MCSTNSRMTMHRVFVSKNVKGSIKAINMFLHILHFVSDHSMLDLSIMNRFGKSVLHYIIENSDQASFRQILDRDELTDEVANQPDGGGDTALMKLLRLGKSDWICDILKHEKANSKFKMDVVVKVDQFLTFVFLRTALATYSYPLGQSLLHLIASLGNSKLWTLAIQDQRSA